MSRICRSEAAGYLALAASPTFAVMALATALDGGGPMAALCGAGTGGWPLDDMVMMYLLMGAFHLSPWLKRRPRAMNGDQ